MAGAYTVQITGYDATTTYKITINSKVVSTLGTGGTAATTAAALQSLLVASTIPEFAEGVWTVLTDTITCTAPNDGTPMTLTSSVSGGAGTIGAVSTATSPVSAYDWATASNWSTGAVPINGDTVDLTQSSIPIKFGLAQSGVTLAVMNADSTFTTSVGLPRYNTTARSANGSSTPYIEYRPTELAIGITALNVGQGTGAGCTMFNVNFGSVQNATTVYRAGTSSQQGQPTIQLRGTHASNSLIVLAGSVGWAFTAGQVGTLATLKLGYETQQQSDASVVVGAGSTLSSCTATQNGGNLQFSSNLSALTMNSGTATGFLTATVSTLDVEGGTYYHQSTGTITTGTIGSNGTMDFSQDPRGRTITNLTVDGGGELNDPNKTCTFTNPISCPSGITGKFGAVLNLGTNFSIQRS